MSIKCINFRNGYIEPVLHPVNNTLHNLAFLLERMIFWDSQENPANTDSHADSRPKAVGGVVLMTWKRCATTLFLLERTANLFVDITFQYIVHLEIGEITDADTTFVVRLDFIDIFFESAK